MHVPDWSNRTDDSTALVPIVLANLVPLVGVLWFGWEATTLVFVYGLEVLLSLVLAAGKALFAQRPPPTDRDGVVSVAEADLTDKRGSVRPIDRLPPIPLRNVPFALGVSFLVGYAILFAAVVAGLVDAAEQLARPGVLLSVVGLVGGQLVETRREYFARRTYERVSPYAVIEPPARQVFVLLFVLFVLGATAGSTAALVLVVCVKLLVEWSTVRATRADADTNRFVDRIVRWIAGPTDDGAGDDNEDGIRHEDRVRAPSSTPQRRVRTDRTAVVLEGALLALWRTGAYLHFVAVGSLFVVLVLVAWLDSVLVFWLGVLAVAVLIVAVAAIEFVRYYLAQGTLEYQRRDDHLVAYDRLVEEPQWATPIDELRDVAVVTDRFADRVLETRTIRVTTGWDSGDQERRLGPVADPDSLVEAFELPLATTDLEPLNRPLAAGAVVLAVGIVLGIPAAFVVPGLGLEARLDMLWIAPAVLVVPWKLWKRACPDPT